jgi:hypothetical protein
MSDFLTMEFYRDLTVNVLGVAVGLFLGFSVERLLESRRKKEKSNLIRQVLIATLERNLALLGQLSREMPDVERAFIPSIPSYRLDSSILNSTSAIKYESLLDLKSCTEIDLALYQMNHLNDRMGYLRQLNLGIPTTGKQESEKGINMSSEYNGIRLLLPQVTEAVSAAKKRLVE